ncbi:hypothetical protein TNIN_312711 [Trichonephila inaurata madagascariensis]|uniref:Uncharacterized protein n=1 Tax=Trichonephila inaurata madagascariensis TaxID=2747483 RepID=A0A8X6YM66_9ARAC|nr:hypothetical protein TNIN_312711 [Trichonephila inaurata madagascariensis]
MKNLYPFQVFNNTEYCSQVQRSTHERIPVFNLNKPSTSSAARQISENNEHSSLNPSIPRGFSSFQSSICEINPYYDENQETVSAEYNPMEYCNIGTNPKHEVNDPALKYAHEGKNEHNISTQCRMSLKNMNLNLEKYSKRYWMNMNFDARSNVLYDEQEQENNECSSQRNAIASLEEQCGRFKMSASYSSQTNCSDFSSDVNIFNQNPSNVKFRPREQSYSCERRENRDSVFTML